MSDSLRSAGHLQILAIDEVGAPPEATDTTAAPRDWIRRHAPWVVVAAVVAVVALVGAQAALDARERDRLAYLAGVPGILRPLPERVSTLWRWTSAESVTPVADDTAGRWTIGTRYRQGDVELRGTDPQTGARLWTTPFPIDDALPPEARGTFPSVWVRCASLSAAQVACGADLAGPAQVVATPLMVLDPTDGTVVSRQVLPAGTLWTTNRGRLVLARSVADDETHTHWVVSATDPRTGAIAWQDRTPPAGIAGPVRIGFTTIDTGADLSSDPDRILLTGNGYAWLWSHDGASRRSVSVDTDGWAELGRAGTLVWTPYQSVVAPAGMLVTDSGRHVAVDGMRADLSVDDGSAPGVVLLRTGLGGTTVVAHDAASGTELWRADGNTGPILVLDGAVIAAGPSTVTSRDARTGYPRWRTRLDATPAYLGADPRHVVVVTDDFQLRSLDLGDGRTSLSADIRSLLGAGPGDLRDVEDHGGRLVLTLRDGSRLALG